jgi:hypothetical protein
MYQWVYPIDSAHCGLMAFVVSGDVVGRDGRPASREVFPAAKAAVV